MRILKYNKFLEEININLGELSKPIITGTFSGTRGDILVSKLEDPNKTINIAGEGEKNITNIVVDDIEKSTIDAVDDITTNGKYDNSKAKEIFTRKNRYSKVLKDSEGDSYALNQIVKDSDFGSKGAGTTTRYYETIQCLYLALKISNPTIELNFENVSMFLDSYNSGFIKNIDLYLTNLESINKEELEKSTNNKDWLATFIRIPEALSIFKNGILFDKSRYSIFHISNKSNTSPVFKLITKFNVLRKNKVVNVKTNELDVNPLHRVDFSKFCPADVYVVKSEFVEEINAAIDASLSVQDLSNLVDRFFDDRKMIPISLKKVKNAIDSFRIIINKERGTKPPTFSIDDFIITNDPMKGIGSRISTRSKWTSDDNTEIDRGSRSMTIDSTDTSKTGNVSGEIDGAIARHGKVSYPVITKLIDATKEIREFSHINNINSYNDLNALSEEILRARTKLLWKILLKNNKQGHINVRSAIAGRDLNSKNKVISKLQSLQILYAIYQIAKVDKSTADDLVTSIMSYALSININMFTTPRYIRII